jgi:hypothetical protein
MAHLLPALRAMSGWGQVQVVQGNVMALKLSGAQIIRLRFCHFPGSSGPGKEVCVADLTEKGKQLGYSGTSSSVIAVGPDFSTSNRTYAQFAVGVPKLEGMSGVVGGEPGEAIASYQASIEPTTMAGMIEIQDQLPSSVSGSAHLRRSSSGWRVVSSVLKPKD